MFSYRSLTFKKHRTYIYRYILFVCITIIATWVIAVSCYGMQHNLIPKHNALLGALEEKEQDKYIELYYNSDDYQQDWLEANINECNDIHALQQFIDIQKEKEIKSTLQTQPPQDNWGTQLPQLDDERAAFLRLVMQFPRSERQELKRLFHNVAETSIENFFKVFFKKVSSDEDLFKQEERIQLLEAMIYLYKILPDITIKLCNRPRSLTIFEQLKILRKSSAYLPILKKLKDHIK